MKGVCVCGGCLEFWKQQHGYSVATDGEFEQTLYKCKDCDKVYRIAKAVVEEITVEDPDPNFLNGVDVANGKV